MKTRSVRLSSMFALAAGCALSSAACAQIMVPPPEKTPGVDENIPKATPPAPRPPKAVATPAVAQVVMPTDVNYDVLIEKDAAGKVKPLTRPIYIAALKGNTKLPPDFWEKAKPFLEERRATMEHVMINNLDLMDQIEDGVFERTGFDQKQVASLLNTARPLMKPAAPDVLTKELKAKNLLDEVQYRVTEQIVRKYTLAANPVPAADLPKEERGGGSFKVLIQLYKIAFDEFVYIHKDLSITAADNLNDLVQTLDADAATTKKVHDVAARLSKSSSDAQKMDAMKSLRDVLTLDQRKELMRQAGAIYKEAHAGK